MLDSFHQFLYDARLFVCFITVPVGLYSAWRCYQAVAGEPAPPQVRTTRRIPSRPPGAPPRPPTADKPVQQQLLADKPAAPASVEAGKESRLNKALASTIRIDSGDGRHSSAGDAAVVTPTKPQPAVADEVNQLFAGLDDKLQPSAEAPRPKLSPQEREADAMAKANRLEQLGFHRPTQHDVGGRPVSDPGKPIEAAKGPELDDILAKLDRVLAEKPAEVKTESAPAAPAPQAAAPATPAAAPASTPAAAKAPLWARADATDDDADTKPDPGKQLGLFEDGKDKPAP